jgi:hypothetical protein
VRKLLAILVAAALPGAGSETIVQSSNPAASACGVSSGTSCTFSPPSATTAGDALVVWLWFGTGVSVTPPSGWTADSGSQYAGAAYTVQFFYRINAPSTSSVAFTIGTSNAAYCGWLYEISSSSGPGWPKWDTSGNAFVSGGSTASGPTLSLNGTDDAILQGVRQPNNITAAGSGYTLETCSNAGAPNGATAYEVSAAADGAMTWTQTGSTGNWLMDAEAFCDAGGSGCTPGGFPQIVRLFDPSLGGYLARLFLPWAPRRANGVDPARWL